MKTSSKSSPALALVALFAASASSGQAATIVNDVAWPGTPAAETVDVHSLSATEGRFIKGTRQIRQTFQTDSTFDVSAFVLSFKDWDGSVGMTLKVFEVSDIEADTWSAGSQVGSTISITGGGSVSGISNIQITLSAAEQFTLTQRNSGSQGYGIELESIGDTTENMLWAHAFDETDHAAGRYYQETGTGQDLAYDMGLGIIAVPESSTLSLVAASLFALLLPHRRRK